MLVSCMTDARFAILVSLLRTLRSAFRTHADRALENLALRQQLATLQWVVVPVAVSLNPCRPGRDEV